MERPTDVDQTKPYIASDHAYDRQRPIAEVLQSSHSPHMLNEAESLHAGNRVRLSGGYGFEPEWLAGKDCVEGTLAEFLPGQNEMPAAVVKLDAPITAAGVTGDVLVLELRHVGAKWKGTGIVHLELCDFPPERRRWQERRQGKWVESHATYQRLTT